MERRRSAACAISRRDYRGRADRPLLPRPPPGRAARPHHGLARSARSSTAASTPAPPRARASDHLPIWATLVRAARLSVREKELRLALVCYGGISLAVYMHGITKEIWRLARASRAFHDGDGAAAGSQARLSRAARRDRRRRAASASACCADIVAGASAGGINGIFLAQAIATGQSLDPLTDLWLEYADVEALLDPDAAPPSRFSKLWAMPLAWMAAGRSADEVDDARRRATRDEVRAQAVALRPLALVRAAVRRRRPSPTCCSTRSMPWRRASAGRACCPPASRSTCSSPSPISAAIPNACALNSPPEVVETEHRLVFAFSRRRRARRHARRAPRTRLRRARDLELSRRLPALHGRASSTRVLDGARRALAGPRRLPGARPAAPRRRQRAPRSAVLIDGSVLANAPFRPAIDALRERPARRQIDRRFVYIDPVARAQLQLSAAARRARASSRPSSARSANCRASSRSATISTRSPTRSARIERLRGDRRRDPPDGGGAGRSAVRLHAVPRSARPPPGSPRGGDARRTPRRAGRLRLCRLRPAKLAGVVDALARSLDAGGRRGGERGGRSRGARRRRRSRASSAPARRWRAPRRSTSCAASTSASASAACACSRGG